MALRATSWRVSTAASLTRPLLDCLGLRPGGLVIGLISPCVLAFTFGFYVVESKKGITYLLNPLKVKLGRWPKKIRARVLGTVFRCGMARH